MDSLRVDVKSLRLEDEDKFCVGRRTKKDSLPHAKSIHGTARGKFIDTSCAKKLFASPRIQNFVMSNAVLHT